MLIVALADPHGFLPAPSAIEDCDLLLIGGDFTPPGLDDKAQERWLARTFSPWLERLPARSVVGIAGNHDTFAARRPDVMWKLPWTYLRNQAAQVADIHIWGSPVSSPFGYWVHQLPERSLSALWQEIPAKTDIILIHGPAEGLGDGLPDGTHLGSPSLRARLEVLPNLKLAVFGHVHEGRGYGTFARFLWLNATLLDDSFEPRYPPFLIELDASGARLLT